MKLCLRFIRHRKHWPLPFSAPGIYFLEKVFRPIATVLVRSTTFLNKHFVKKSHNISVDELSHALELTDKAELSEE